jgi:hypothetical protein
MMDEMHDNERIYADMAGNVSDQDIRNMTEVLLAWAEAIEKLKTKPDVRTVFLACVQTIGTMGPAYCRLAAVNLAKRAEEGMRE